MNEVRSWLLLENQKYSPLNDEQVRHFIIPYDELPESLKEIANDGLIHFNQNDLGNPSLIQTCGGGLLRWGFYIRLLDKEYSDPNEWKSNWILIEPGFIVYAN